MTIHSTSFFSTCEIPFHMCFDIDLIPDDILKNEVLKKKVIGASVSLFKKKCESHFKIDFNSMVSFEVYFYEEGKEFQIYKKEKTLSK